MHVHNYEKLWLGLSMLLIVAFIGTVTYGAVGAGVDMVGNGETVNPETLADHPDFGDPGVEQVGPDEYEVHVVARQFFFQPGTNEPITVPEDSTVTVHVTSGDVIHGFSVPGTNANTMVIPGEVATITVDVDEPRTYGLVCHEYCGAAHHEMAGTLEVVPEGEFEGVSEG
jgi:cytochrome c oxidase subunit 2